MSTALKPFLAGSFGLHAVGATIVLFAAQRGVVKTDKVYMIDFVGPSATITSARATQAAAPSAVVAAPAAPQQQADPDSFARPGSRGPVALPRPSLLRGAKEEPAVRPPTTPTIAPAQGTSPAQSAAGPGGPAGAGISTDLPNFPYPWYISQVRLMLWQTWQKRMPRLDAEGGVVFSILRNGSATDLRIESSSGEGDFDRAAIESVQAALPFPALPSDFREPFLKIHLTLKSEQAWR